MALGGTARRIASSGRALVTASLFFVLIWWRASLYLFVTGALVYCVGWVLSRGAVPELFTAQE